MKSLIFITLATIIAGLTGIAALSYSGVLAKSGPVKSPAETKSVNGSGADSSNKGSASSTYTQSVSGRIVCPNGSEPSNATECGCTICP